MRSSIIIAILCYLCAVSAAVVKRDSADVISPLPNAEVIQNSTIEIKTWRWGMSYFGGGNYTVQSLDNIVVYGPVIIEDYGVHVQNMSVIGVGSYKLVLLQKSIYAIGGDVHYSTTVVPFTVVDHISATATPTTTTSEVVSDTTSQVVIDSPVSVTTTPTQTSTVSDADVSGTSSASSSRVNKPGYSWMLLVIVVTYVLF